jgi:hypothetical protein
MDDGDSKAELHVPRVGGDILLRVLNHRMFSSSAQLNTWMPGVLVETYLPVYVLSIFKPCYSSLVVVDRQSPCQR